MTNHTEVVGGRFSASTPLEFRVLLGTILAGSKLTAGQIAIKADIPRSQAYNLYSTSRSSLPSRPEQVRAFVEACGLMEHEIAAVMRTWARLAAEARSGGSATPATTATNGSTSSATTSSEQSSVVLNKRRRQLGSHPGELFFLIVDQSHRTRHALQLIYPVVGAYIAMIVGIVVLAVTNSIPMNALYTLLAVVVLGPSAIAARLVRRF